MPCQTEGVPEYLHWNGCQVYNDSDFASEDSLYRITENPNEIEFPSGTITALSCKWSQLIAESDIFKVPPFGKTYKYAVIQSLRDFSLKRVKDNGDNTGCHKLTCELEHIPEECDYSHCVILIKHEIFSNELENELVATFCYSYEIWQNGNPLLKSKSKYYKQLRGDYRLSMIKIFSLP